MTMFKRLLMKKMLKSQMKGVPDGEIDRIVEVVDKNPDLFQKIAGEIQAKVKGGMNQQMASMEVMKMHEVELRRAMEEKK